VLHCSLATASGVPGYNFIKIQWITMMPLRILTILVSQHQAVHHAGAWLEVARHSVIDVLFLND
jgi:hypothetical protein